MAYYAQINSRNEIQDFSISTLLIDEYGSNEVQNIEVSTEIYNNAQQYGSNYYIYSDNKIVLNPNYEEEQERKERERIAQLYLTSADVERAIYKDKGLDFEDILALLDNFPEIDKKAVRIEFKANNFYRGNPYVNQIGTLLGYSQNQLDYLFEHKEFPPEEEAEE